MNFKFWKWRIEVKVRDMDADQKIIYLSRELLKTAVKDGKELKGKNSSIRSISIDVFPDGEAWVGNMLADWKVSFNWDKKENPCSQQKAL